MKKFSQRLGGHGGRGRVLTALTAYHSGSQRKKKVHAKTLKEAAGESGMYSAKYRELLK